MGTCEWHSARLARRPLPPKPTETDWGRGRSQRVTKVRLVAEIFLRASRRTVGAE